MNTTQSLESIHGLGLLTKSTVRAVLTGGLGLAAMGLFAGTADATPGQPTIACPADYEIGHQGGVPFTVELSGWPQGGTLTVHEDGPMGTPVGRSVTVDQTMAASTTTLCVVPTAHGQ
jgi:hypothetical protein